MSEEAAVGGRVEVTRTYLEMGRPEDLAAAAAPDVEARVQRMHGCPPSFYRYLYGEVGRAYRWVDRLAWTDQRLRDHLSDPTIGVWLFTVEGAPAGYFELKRHDDRSVEIAYFGLLPDFVGRGLGKYLLTLAVEQAWGLGPARLWLHTCTLDDPAALPNYQRRGFRPFRTETYWIEPGGTTPSAAAPGSEKA